MVHVAHRYCRLLRFAEVQDLTRAGLTDVQSIQGDAKEIQEQIQRNIGILRANMLSLDVGSEGSREPDEVFGQWHDRVTSV